MPARTRAYRPDAPIVAEIAAGAVVVRDHARPIFLLHQVDEDRWCFPKGHVDPGESLTTAAAREIREETGFERVVLGEELCEVSYRFFQPKRAVNIQKIVIYFLGTTDEERPVLEPTFDRGEWVTAEEADRRVAYDLDRTVLRAARVRLERGP